jgi:hypothetical protein
VQLPVAVLGRLTQDMPVRTADAVQDVSDCRIQVRNEARCLSTAFCGWADLATGLCRSRRKAQRHALCRGFALQRRVLLAWRAAATQASAAAALAERYAECFGKSSLQRAWEGWRDATWGPDVCTAACPDSFLCIVMRNSGSAHVDDADVGWPGLEMII